MDIFIPMERQERIQIIMVEHNIAQNTHLNKWMELYIKKDTT